MTGRHPTRERSAASLAENPYAGQGPVLLDIGADTGGLVVNTDAGLLGAEIEIVAGLHRRRDAQVHLMPHSKGSHVHGHPDDHKPTHTHGPHAEVLARPLPDGSSQPCAVYPDVTPGWYTLQVLPHGDCMPVRVHAGTVTIATWEAQPRTA